MGTPKLKNNASEGHRMKQERDNPLPKVSSVMPYIGFSMGFVRLCRSLKIQSSQMVLLMVLSNSRLKGYSATFLCKVLYGGSSGANVRGLYFRLEGLKRLGFVEHVGNRYRLSVYCWEVLGKGLESVGDKKG